MKTPDRLPDRRSKPPGAPAGSVRGRGTAANPRNRFERIDIDFEPGESVAERGVSPSTELFRDHSKTILSRNDSPDIGFEYSLNPYRGCEHGCIYCYARPTHEFLGFSAGLDFESRILVKERAPELLRKALLNPRWKPQVIVLSGVTDPYQPIERKLQITRRCLEILAEFRNPVAIITKNHLVTRDLDLLLELNRFQACGVYLSITSVSASLSARMEPRASTPRRRFDALRELSAAGIPCGVMAAPIIPGLNDDQIPAILEAAAEAGANRAGYILVRLPHGLRELFSNWLATHFPDRRDRVLNRLREARDGNLNDPRFHHRMKGGGEYAEQIGRLFETVRRRVGLDGGRSRRLGSPSASAFRRRTDQRSLFDEAAAPEAHP
ncbi:MAG: PA0069 family radical SAM protein [Acidobacteriota bacterium]|nr:PA0069 family radical SAM protein [Acidobacteriota bacterium]